MQRYRNLKVAIIASGLFTEGGDWRSIYFFARSQETRNAKIALINPSGKRGLRQLLAAGRFAPRLIVNGLGTLACWRVLLVCSLRRDARIYLHETGYMLDQFKKESPLRYRLVARVLGRNPILCVSRQAESHYRERFGATCTHVVYECPGAGESVKLESQKTHIVMVGSINERKGVELFSKVADISEAVHPEWQFHWIGGLATMNPIYQSKRVIWHGWVWTPAEIVRQCHVFFLTSVDDPCPLSALEALQAGKRCVAYQDTGTAELISDLTGCAVFREYTPQAALAALETALTSDTAVAETICANIKAKTGLEAFGKSIVRALQ